jgi:hypothetical protein
MSEINGSIAVHGCEVNPEELMIRARPALPPQQLSNVDGSGRRSQVVKAALSSTGGYEFRFNNLASLTPYRLGVKLIGRSAQRCGKLVWNISRDPLVMGGQEPISFDAYAVASQIEVLGEAGPNRAEPGWFGADALDIDNAVNGTRLIRWRSNIPNATGGRLQVSLRPFPRIGERGYNPCSDDVNDGIVHEINFDAVPGEWATIPVNFHVLLGGGRASDDGDTRTDNGLFDGPADGFSPVSDADMAAINAGRPIHVRVLPRVGEDALCDPDRGGVPPEVIFAIIKVLKSNMPEGDPVFSIDKMYYSKPAVDLKHPKAGETCYRVTKEHLLCDIEGGCYDYAWDYAVAYNSSKTMYDTVNPGFQFCIPHSYWDSDDDDGWLESFVNTFGSVLTAIVDAAGKLVNSASAAWEDIQNYAVGAVASGIKVLGVPCDNTCQAVLKTGLEVGLASMGVPPSLPNFDQLVDQGADYMAAQVGSQLGVPSVLTDYASDEAQDFIKKAVKDMKDRNYSVKGLPDWLVPDIRFEPAVLTLELYGTGIPLPSQPGIIRANDAIYAGKFVQLPKLLPKKEKILLPGLGEITTSPLRFPMVLDPNLHGLPPVPADKNDYDAAVWDKGQWLEKRYTFGPLQGCYHLNLTGLAPSGDHIFNLTDIRFTTQDAIGCSW